MEKLGIGAFRPLRLGATVILVLVAMWAVYEGWVNLPSMPIFGLLVGIGVFVTSIIVQETVREGVVHALAVAATVVSATVTAVAVALNWTSLGQLDWLGFILFIVCLLIALAVIWWATSESKRD